VRGYGQPVSEPNDHGSRRPTRVVAIGASAGGLSPITCIVGSLPEDLDAAVLVVLHLAPTAPSALPSILARQTRLPVTAPADGDPLVAGHVYVARPDYHLEVEDGSVRVLRGPWENGHRPSIDVLFRSVAKWWGDGAIGVELSGALDDGTAGLRDIRACGGVALVQDPHDASVPGMPLAAIEAGAYDEVHPVRDLGPRITELCRSPIDPPAETMKERERRVPSAGSAADMMRHVGEPQVPPNAPAAGFVCPDCGGAMFEVTDDGLTFRCRVGHAWSAEALHGANSRQFEEALWTAMRILEEDHALQKRMAARARTQQRSLSLRRIERRIAERTRLVELLRSVMNERAFADEDAANDEQRRNAGDATAGAGG
jgi:two-component system, chemotaxis family, protein-glutamate methylesterase/glutaminase